MSSSRPQRTPARPQSAPTNLSSEQPGLLRRLPAIIYTADAGESGAWHHVSPQIESILGFTPAEWCADPDLWAGRLHPEDRERVIETESRILDGAPSPGVTEYRLVHRDGSIVWVRDHALLVEDDDGRSACAAAPTA